MTTLKDTYYKNFRIIRTILDNKKTLVQEVEFQNYSEGCGYPKYAIAKQYRGIESNARILKEAKILQFVGKLHKNIVQFYHHIKKHRKILIFMEICSQDNLYNVMLSKTIEKHWTEGFLLKKFATITDVLALLHWHTIDVAHRDLKPHNIFVCKNGEWKIGDFGGAKRYVTCNNLNTIEGTTNYMSPLMLEKLSEGVIRSTEIDPKKEDVYSLGKTFYEILTKNFGVKFEEDETKNREKIKTEMSNWNYRQALTSIILEMVAYEPNSRPTMSEVHDKIMQLLSLNLTATSDYSKNQIGMQVEKTKGSAREGDDIFSLEARSESKPASAFSEYQSEMQVRDAKASARECDNLFSIEFSISRGQPECSSEYFIEEGKSIEAFAMNIDSNMRSLINDYFDDRANEYMPNNESESTEATDHSNTSISSSEVSFPADLLATDNRAPAIPFSARSVNHIIEPSSYEIIEDELSNYIVCPYCALMNPIERFESFISTSLNTGMDITEICCSSCGNRFPEDFIEKILSSLAHEQ